MFTTLDTHLDDPTERIRAIQACTVGAKEEHKAVGADMLQNWAEYAAPNTFNLASRLYSSWGLADSHRPIHNVIISNVPGPAFPLYYAGAEMVAAYPMGPVMEGVGPQHHRDQLPGLGRLRLHGRPRAGARRLGHGRPGARTPSPSSRRPPASRPPRPPPDIDEAAAAAPAATEAAAAKAPAKKAAAKKAAPTKAAPEGHGQEGRRQPLTAASRNRERVLVSDA